MITPQGYLFSKEAILQYFVDQKKSKKRQLAEWEADQKRRSQLVRNLPSLGPCIRSFGNSSPSIVRAGVPLRACLIKLLL